MIRGRRIIRGLLIGVVGLVALTLLFVTFVLFTSPGAKLALRMANGRDLPVRASSINGALVRRFTLYGVVLALGPAEATLDTVTVDWKPLALRERRVQLNELIIAGGHVVVRATASDTTRTAPADTSKTTPWTVNADRLLVRGVSADLPENDVHVSGLELSGSGGPDAYRAEVRVAGSVPRVSNADAYLRVAGNTQAATIDTLHVHALDGDVRGNAFVRWEPALSWRARVGGDSLSVASLLSPDAERPGPVSFRVASTGLVREDSMRVALDVDSLASTFRDRAVAARGRVDLDGTRITASNGLVQWGSSHVSLSGSLDGDSVDVTLDAVIPVLAEILPSARGSASLKGTVAGSSPRFDVDMKLTGRDVRVEAIDLPDFTASLDATAIADTLVPHMAEIRRAAITTPEGNLDARGSVSWRDGIAWNCVLAADNVQVAAVTPSRWNLRGPVSLRASTEGTKQGERLRGAVALESLSGAVRNLALDGSGRVALDNGQIDLSSLDVQWGDTHVRADGSAGEMLDLNVDLVAPRLAEIDSSLQGSVSLRGSATGPRARPRVNAELTADSLRVLTYAAHRLEGHVDADLSFASPADVKLLALDVTRGETRADTVRVSVSGPRDDHRVELFVVADSTRVSLGLRGALAGTYGRTDTRVGSTSQVSWSGWIDELRVAPRKMQTWELRARAPLFISRSRATLDSLVLGAGESRLVAHGAWQRGDTTRAAIRVDGLELAQLQRFLADSVRVTGTARADAAVSIAPDGAIAGRADIVPGPGEFVLDERRISYGGRITGRANEQGVSARIELDLQQAGAALATVDGDVSIPNFVPGRDSLGTQPIEGGIDVECRNIAALIALVAPAPPEGASGTLSAHVSPVGTAGDFRIMGKVVVEDGRVDLRNGLRLRDADLTLVSDGKGSVTLDGAVTSGGGRIVLKAESARSEKGWINGTFAARGERFLLINQPEARLYVSPDLDVRISERTASVTGKVRVPYARIETAEVPASAVTPSKDVVVIEDTLSTKPAWQVRTNVRVELGDSVSFSGFGLQARLAGNLTVYDERGQTTRGTGEIQVVEGRYRAYGNELRIDQGRFVFGGGPIDNPGLDIRATRGLSTQNVMAGSGEMVGLNLRGTLREPQMSLFSNPPMSDSEIMSYLVLGRPLDSGEDQSALASAALLVGMQQGSGIAGSVGDAFALDEAYIEGGDEAREASFVAGKYLSPKLYIAYATGLFEKTNTFRVRYSLDRKWTLQAESGDESSTDLLYWFERGKKK